MSVASAVRNPAILLIHCAIFLATAAAATPPPLSFARTEIPVGPGCCSLVSADFNGDGKLDLATTVLDSLAPRQLLVLMGNGDGSFTAKPVVDLGRSMVLVAAVDVNEDRKPDLLVTDGSSAFLLLGNGDGTFQSPKMIASAPLLRVADFNGDGKPDLLFRHLDVQLGNGDGTFGNTISTPADVNNSTALNFLAPLVIADFNRDGKLDVAFNSAWHDGRGVAFVWLGNGDGTFTPKPENNAFENHFNPAAVLAAGDFDGDGKLDLVVGGGFPFFGVLLGNGDGTFRKGMTGALPGALLVAGDFNGDGKLDLASESSIALGNGDGSFQPAISFGYGAVAYTSSEFTALSQYPPIIAADLNRDGTLDLVAPSRLTGTFTDAFFISSGLSVLLNNSPGPASSVIGVSSANGARVLAPGSIATIYGSNLAPATASAPASCCPTTNLGGISLHLRDALGTDRLALLFYVSPSQVNFVVPNGAAEGLGTLNIDNGTTPFVEGQRATAIKVLAPSFFSADGTGTGPAAATAVRVLADGRQFPVTVFTCSNGRCTTVPIDLSQGAVYLSLYGTGFRASSLPYCQIQNEYVRAAYGGPQFSIAGLDQLNVRLPQLANLGEIDVVCSFGVGYETASSPPVKINIK